MTTDTKPKRAPKPTNEELAASILSMKSEPSWFNCTEHGQTTEVVRARWKSACKVKTDDPRRALISNCDCCTGPLLRVEGAIRVPLTDEFCSFCSQVEGNTK